MPCSCIPHVYTIEMSAGSVKTFHFQFYMNHEFYEDSIISGHILSLWLGDIVDYALGCHTCSPEAEFLTKSKSLKSFPPCYSPLYSVALRFLFLQTHATSYSFFSVLLYTLKEKGRKPDRKSHPIPYGYEIHIENHTPFPMVMKSIQKLAGRSDNPMSELTLSPQSESMNSATALYRQSPYKDSQDLTKRRHE